MKLREPTRADADGRKYHHRQLLAQSLHQQGLDTSLVACGAQDIPARLVWKVDIENNQIERSGSKVRQCGMSILSDAHLVLARLKIALQQVAQDLVILNQQNSCSAHTSDSFLT